MCWCVQWLDGRQGAGRFCPMCKAPVGRILLMVALPGALVLGKTACPVRHAVLLSVCGRRDRNAARPGQ